MLKPRDGAEKDEGELTGGKKLIRRLKERHGHFADVIVADALYLNAPFINTIKECGLDAVIRLKDERRELFQDAESMFQRDEGRKRSFRKGKKSIEVWDLSGFEIDLDDILSGLKYEDGHYDLVTLSDKDYQKKLDVQIAYWDKLKNEIQKVRSGENGTADLVDMSETYFQMADETVAAVKVSRANRQLEQKAYIDLHTGLPNKSKCEELFHNVEFIKTPTACIVFDMNNLKRVNDSLGHSIGDQLILNFARLLRNSIPAKHFVGRYSGDEFMAVIYDATRESITEILTELQNEVEQFNGYGTQFRISYSHGWALSTDYNECTLRTLFDKEDKYMYENKQQSKQGRQD